MRKKEKDSIRRIEDLINEAKTNNLFILIFNDTETTGSIIEDRIIQSAHSVCLINDKFDLNSFVFKHYVEEYIKPPLPIKPEAAVVHGIWEEDVFNKKVKEWEFSISNLELKLLSECNLAYYVAHNSPFDLAMLNKEGVYWEPMRVIDTLAVSRFLFKDERDIKYNKLQYFRYLFNFDKEEDFKNLVKMHGVKKIVAHTALSDIIVLIYFYIHLLKNKLLLNIDQAVLLSSKPLLIDKVKFGNKFEKGSSLYNAICSRDPNGLDYFKWAMINMTNLSIMDKMSISYFTIKAFKDKAIPLEKISLATPMIHVAACFIPEHWNFLNSIGYKLNILRFNSLSQIELNIKELENSNDLEIKSIGFEKRRELNFLNNYTNNFPNDTYSN